MSLILYHKMDVKKACEHCNMRAVGGRVYVKEPYTITSRYLYECGLDVEQDEDGIKIIHHSCGKALDKPKAAP